MRTAVSQQGKDGQIITSHLCLGLIGAVLKRDFTKTSYSLCDKSPLIKGSANTSTYVSSFKLMSGTFKSKIKM